jgi:hypothetical protein
VFNFPVIKEMQIKRKLRFHLTPIRMDIIKGNNNKCWQGCGKTDLYTPLVGMQISTTTVENSMEIPQKTRDRIAVCSNDTASGQLPKRK